MYRPQQTQDELELETMAEVELSRLKRQYRIMENDRAACAEDARLQLRNQQNMIEHLEQEKAELVLVMKTAKSRTFARKDEEMNENLRCLLEKRANYIELIDNERRQIAQLDEQIGKVTGIAAMLHKLILITFFLPEQLCEPEDALKLRGLIKIKVAFCNSRRTSAKTCLFLQLSKEVGNLKMKVRTDTQLREMTARHARMILMLENRVEVATKRFNQVIAENAKLRTEIETLLKERAQFTQTWNKLLGQLNTGKQIINDLIEQATITFNQRDEELNKIQALRER